MKPDARLPGRLIARIIVSATVSGSVLVCDEGLSVWGGVDPETGVIIDAHHPQQGQSLAGRVVMMPTSRGSCTGSGVLLGLALAGRALENIAEAIRRIGGFLDKRRQAAE